MAVYLSENFDAQTVGAVPSTFGGTGIVVSSGVSLSASRSVTIQTAGAFDAIYSTAVDTNTGNSRVRGAVRYTSASVTGGVGLRHNGITGYASATFYVAQLTTTGIQIQKFVTGTQTSVVASSFASSFTTGSWYNIDFIAVGTALSVGVQRASDNLWLQGDGTWGVTLARPVSGTDTTITGAGHSCITVYNLIDGFNVDNFYFTDNADTTGIVSSASFTASPTSVPISATTTVNLTGVATGWTSGTTFVLTGVAGVTFTKTFVDATHYTLSITASTTAGTLNISDGTVNVNIAIVIPPVLVRPNNAAVFVDASSVFFDGTNSANVVDNGTEFKGLFSGTSLALDLDITAMRALSPSLYPRFLVSIDFGVIARIPIGSPTTNTLRLTLATGLAAGTHSYQFWFEYDPTIEPAAYFVGVFINYFVLDNGATLSAPSGLVAKRPKRALIMGDSRTKSYGPSDSANKTPGDYPPMGYPQILMRMLNAEGGQVGKSAMGWIVTTVSSGNQNFPQCWNFVAPGNSRTLSGLDYLIVAHGTNDTSDVTSVVTAWIVTARAAVGANCWIILCTPARSNAHSTEIQNAVIAYKSAHTSDLKVGIVDTNSIFPQPTKAQGIAVDMTSVDGLHPDNIAASWEAAAIGNQILTLTAATTSTTIITKKARPTRGRN